MNNLTYDENKLKIKTNFPVLWLNWERLRARDDFFNTIYLQTIKANIPPVVYLTFSLQWVDCTKYYY